MGRQMGHLGGGRGRGAEGTWVGGHMGKGMMETWRGQSRGTWDREEQCGWGGRGDMGAEGTGQPRGTGTAGDGGRQDCRAAVAPSSAGL